VHRGGAAPCSIPPAAPTLDPATDPVSGMASPVEPLFGAVEEHEEDGAGSLGVEDGNNESMGARKSRRSAHEREGLVRLSSEAIEVTTAGQFFLRNLAMCFDRYRRGRGMDPRPPVSSRTV
jgi:hypothetical protein